MANKFICILKALHPSYLINFPLQNITSLVAQMVKHLSTMRETQVRSLCREDPLEKEMATHSNTIAWKIHGWRRLVGYSPRGRKESDTTERLHLFFFPLQSKETLQNSQTN